MKALLITTLVFTLGSSAYTQTESSTIGKTDCKEQHTAKTQKAKSKEARGKGQASTRSAEAVACPQAPDPTPNASTASTTPTAALSAATVAPPVDRSDLNVTIYHDPGQESLGAAARKIRAKKAAEEASKVQ